MASTGEAGRVRFVVAVVGALVAAVALLGPIWWEQTHHRDRDGFPAYHHAVTPPLDGYDDPRVQRRPGERTLPYVERVTQVVSDATYHCDKDDPDQSTWEVALLARTTGGMFFGNEGVLHADSFRCGFCSQVSTITAEILRNNGVSSADPYGLNGHVVVEFADHGLTYTTDPDFGVGPMRVDWSDPQQLRDAVAVTYDEPMVWPVKRLQRIYSDTAGDPGEYSRLRMGTLAAWQGARVEAVSVGRWVVAGLGVLIVVIAWRTGSGPRTSEGSSSVDEAYQSAGSLT